ncbi:MAG TPA: hypothetical protein VGQ02_10785 [Candidatus Limnocylindrales bacterium]|nr:hypothetical protein [Candidatus Limnocylindrales bacterium]
MTDTAGRERLREAQQARFALESWVHQQTPTKTLSQEQITALSRLVDEFAAAAAHDRPSDDTARREAAWREYSRAKRENIGLPSAHDRPSGSVGLRVAVDNFLDEYDKTHLVHDVVYEDVNDAVAILRTALSGSSDPEAMG